MHVRFLPIIICCLLFNATQLAAQQPAYPFQDLSLSFEQRVNDLVSRLTLEEKVGQMLNAAPAIPALGIPAYDWWNETLHGVARTPYNVTVYPQAIAMAATFDTSALQQMASFSATEGRAVYNRAIRQGNAGQRYVGLTYWTPNINIFRDPRWGRGQETYGEDPFLTAMMGRSFVNGLQGNDPKYLHAAACAKHYAVHSGPEPSRHVFNVDPSDRDLWNTYLPAFKELILHGHVAGVMCAYNAFKTQPCCGSDELMVDILRHRWQFNGYVTSDCWGIDDFFKNHKTHPDAAAASADAVLHGTDIECGTDAYKSLVAAVKAGKITEQQIDVSVKRLFLIRFRLGLFDPVSMVKYAQVTDSVLESSEHRALSLKMARESIVLLKNEANLLPLKKGLKKIAVIGPNADNPIAILGNYNGLPSSVVTALQGIRQQAGMSTEVTYERAVNFTNDSLFEPTALNNQFIYEGKKGFLAEYFGNNDLHGEPLATRMETAVQHNWQEGELVIDTLKAYHFSARYASTLTASADTVVSFELDADDGYRCYVDEKEVLNAWTRNRWGARTFRLAMKKGQTYRIRLEYYQTGGKAAVKFTAGRFQQSDVAGLTRRVKDADVIIFVGGISPQLEGEEMPVNYPGFSGGDRTTVRLPAVQTKLLTALQSTGRPVIFVMMTGSAIAIPWEATHIPAILNAWYGGQSAGTAIADVLFGNYNPSGRLPFTVYKSDTDLPDFSDYSMANRTYRYFKGSALYPFGFGMSYTRFTYDRLLIRRGSDKTDAIAINADVTNTGNRKGDEVVQLYVTVTGRDVPIRSLKGFTRVSLEKGEKKRLQFILHPNDITPLDDNGNPLPLQGSIKISVGGCQPYATTASARQTVQGSFMAK